MANEWIRASPTGTRIDVRVIPRARKDAIEGLRDGRLLVRISAPPVDRAANEAVIALLARVLEVPRRAVRIASGETARNKVVDIAGMTLDVAMTRIRPALPP